LSNIHQVTGFTYEYTLSGTTTPSTGTVTGLVYDAGITGKVTGFNYTDAWGSHVVTGITYEGTNEGRMTGWTYTTSGQPTVTLSNIVYGERNEILEYTYNDGSGNITISGISPIDQPELNGGNHVEYFVDASTTVTQDTGLPGIDFPNIGLKTFVGARTPFFSLRTPVITTINETRAVNDLGQEFDILKEVHATNTPMRLIQTHTLKTDYNIDGLLVRRTETNEQLGAFLNDPTVRDFQYADSDDPTLVTSFVYDYNATATLTASQRPR
jgi:hypothetical protein